MESLTAYFDSRNLSLPALLTIGGVLLLGFLIIGLIGRFIFGRKSLLIASVSSAIGILFIYAVTVVCSSVGGDLSLFVTPLPFISIFGEQMHIFAFSDADYTIICSQLTSMIILSFMINLADGWMPSGKKFFTWLLFRCLTVVIGLIMHLIVVWAFTKYLPEGIVTYAPAILLTLLLLMILTGALKRILGLVLTTVNPLIAALYTFFFSNIIGKQIFKAALTTALLSGLVLLLEYLGCTVLGIAATALIAYVPFVLLLIALWYLVNHKL